MMSNPEDWGHDDCEVCNEARATPPSSFTAEEIAAMENAGPKRTRCSVSYPHPQHDWCDGNPEGKTLGQVAREMTTPTVDMRDPITAAQGIRELMIDLAKVKARNAEAEQIIRRVANHFADTDAPLGIAAKEFLEET